MLKRLSNTFCLLFIIIAPVSYDTHDEPERVDSSYVTLRTAGGSGQYVSVLSSCSKIIKVTKNNYRDYGLDLEAKPRSTLPIVVGLRGGHISTDFGDGSASLENGYINPHLAFETRYFGAGVGLLRNLGPVLDGNLLDLEADFRQEKNFFSAHMRLGDRQSFYLLGAFNEGVPIVSEYGYFLLGMGFGGIRSWKFATGLSAGFYNEPGLYVSVAPRLDKKISGDFSLRLGSSKSEFEGGFSVGLTYSIK